MKKASFLIAFILLIGIMVPTSYAALDCTDSNAYQETEVVHTELGDIEVESTVVELGGLEMSNAHTRYSAIPRNCKTAYKIHRVKYDGKLIAVVALSATFHYDGKAVRISNSDIYHQTWYDWSFHNMRWSAPGNTASISGELLHTFRRNISINISLTCSPTGQIS